MEKRDFEKQMYDLKRKIKEAKDLIKVLTDSEKRTESEVIRGILEFIVEGFTESHCGPSFVNGIARNEGIKKIVKELNNLQEECVFQDEYEVTYKEKS
ncbi:hypothetical protein J7L36_01635 [bacterium]|nr:hypothetical protein [bacterium]